MSDNDSAAAYEALMQFLYRAPIGLVQTTPDGEIEMINPTSAKLLMPLATDGALDNLFTVLQGVAPQLRALAQAAPHEGDVVCEALRIGTSAAGAGAGAGEQAGSTLSISLVRLGGGRLMAVMDDISQQVRDEQRVLEQRLRHAALTDTLTQLPNRAALSPLITRALRTARAGGPGFAVLFLNCDRFKRINDQFGTAIGDGLLAALANRLRTVLGTVEATAARVGGDEFVVLLGGLAGPGQAMALGQQVVDALGAPCSVAEQVLTCTLSGGLLLADTAEGDADAVIRDASIAMLEAKGQGGGRLVGFEPKMRERAMYRDRVEAELRTALCDDQLFVVYQPIVALPAQGAPWRCVGVEALVRWQHPRRGIVPPLEFIAVAEACGLIGALGDFVLATSVRQQAQWRQTLGPQAPGWTAVNLSRAQLLQPGFVASVKALLVAHGLPPACLQLEVTESLAAQDATVQRVLQQLKALGVVIALDDFGTGYSSLSSLHQFPVDVVKIDRSFTSQVDTSLHHRVLVQATVMVAKSLGMSTVVEGVETEPQAALVSQLGCDKGQGYLFSRPMQAQALSAWLQSADAASCAAKALTA